MIVSEFVNSIQSTDHIMSGEKVDGMCSCIV